MKWISKNEAKKVIHYRLENRFKLASLDHLVTLAGLAQQTLIFT
jgi:hypothetical protein